MNEWMNELMDGWIYGWIDGWMMFLLTPINEFSSVTSVKTPDTAFIQLKRGFSSFLRVS